MNKTSTATTLGLAALFGLLTAGCSSGAHATASRATYLAQSAAMQCRPGESTLACCIKKFPATAVASCGATAVEVADVLNGARVINEVAQEASEEVRKETKEEAEEDPDEGYRQHCIDTYVLCVQRKWTGNCKDCMRYCQGQKQWPFHMCTKR